MTSREAERVAHQAQRRDKVYTSLTALFRGELNPIPCPPVPASSTGASALAGATSGPSATRAASTRTSSPTRSGCRCAMADLGRRLARPFWWRLRYVRRLRRISAQAASELRKHNEELDHKLGACHGRCDRLKSFLVPLKRCWRRADHWHPLMPGWRRYGEFIPRPAAGRPMPKARGRRRIGEGRGS